MIFRQTVNRQALARLADIWSVLWALGEPPSFPKTLFPLSPSPNSKRPKKSKKSKKAKRKYKRKAVFWIFGSFGANLLFFGVGDGVGDAAGDIDGDGTASKICCFVGPSLAGPKVPGDFLVTFTGYLSAG